MFSPCRWAQLALAGLLIAYGLMGTAVYALSADELLALADRPWQLFTEVTLQVRATVYEDDQETTTADLDVYLQGQHRALIVFRDGLQAGRKVLAVDQAVWLLVPGSSRPIPVTPNQRLLGGAAMSDIALLRFAPTFSATLAATPETINGLLCDVLQLRAKTANAAYASGVLWIDHQERLVRRAVFNLASGKPARELVFERYRSLGPDQPVVAVMTVRDLLTTAKRLVTRFEFSNHQAAHFSGDFFTPAAALQFGETEFGRNWGSNK